jgi:hypothetical protein
MRKIFNVALYHRSDFRGGAYGCQEEDSFDSLQPLLPCNFAVGDFVPLSDRVEVKPLLPLQAGSNGLRATGVQGFNASGLQSGLRGEFHGGDDRLTASFPHTVFGKRDRRVMGPRSDRV